MNAICPRVNDEDAIEDSRCSGVVEIAVIQGRVVSCSLFPFEPSLS